MSSKHLFITLSTLVVLLFSFITCSNILDKPSSKSEVTLEWKVDDDEEIIYETVMEEIGDQEFRTELGDLFKKLRNSDSKDKAEEFFDKLRNVQANTIFKTHLIPSENFENVVDIEMIAEPKGPDNKGEDKVIRTALTGTVLRGAVSKDGSLQSFWLKSEQKNLISMFFELPGKPVSKGESWSLNNVNLIANDQNFLCKKAEKKNVVTLSEILDRDGETIAVINYDIREFVDGDFVAPSIMGNGGGSTPTTIEFIYKATGEFSEDRGRWVSLTGIMSLTASGALTANQNQKLSLVELKN